MATMDVFTEKTVECLLGTFHCPVLMLYVNEWQLKSQYATFSDFKYIHIYENIQDFTVVILGKCAFCVFLY